MATPTLETARLVLRPLALADAPAVQRHFAHWAVIRRLGMTVPWPYPPDGAEEFIRTVALPKMASGEGLFWGIVPKAGPDEVVGAIDFRFQPGPAGNRGFWLGEEFQGRGYMTEAVSAVQDYLFFDLRLERILVANAKGNRASRRVKEKTGARLVKTIDLEHHDGTHEAELWEVTRETWAALRADP